MSPDFLKVIFPQGSLQNNQKITVESSTEATIPNTDSISLSETLSLEPSGFTFDNPVTVILPYTGAEDTSGLYIARYSHGGKVDKLLPLTIDTENKTVTFATDHFSQFEVKRALFSSDVKEESLDEIEEVVKTEMDFTDFDKSNEKEVEMWINVLNTNLSNVKDQEFTIYDMYLQYMTSKKISEMIDKTNIENKHYEAYDYFFPKDAQVELFKRAKTTLNGIEFMSNIQDVTTGALSPWAEGKGLKDIVLGSFGFDGIENSVETISTSSYDPIGKGREIIAKFNAIFLNKQIENYFSLRNQNVSYQTIKEKLNESKQTGSLVNIGHLVNVVNGWITTGQGTRSSNDNIELLCLQLESLYSTYKSYQIGEKKENLKALMEKRKETLESQENPHIDININLYRTYYQDTPIINLNPSEGDIKWEAHGYKNVELESIYIKYFYNDSSGIKKYNIQEHIGHLEYKGNGKVEERLEYAVCVQNRSEKYSGEKIYEEVCEPFYITWKKKKPSTLKVENINPKLELQGSSIEIYTQPTILLDNSGTVLPKNLNVNLCEIVDKDTGAVVKSNESPYDFLGDCSTIILSEFEYQNKHLEYRVTPILARKIKNEFPDRVFDENLIESKSFDLSTMINEKLNDENGVLPELKVVEYKTTDGNVVYPDTSNNLVILPDKNTIEYIKLQLFNSHNLNSVLRFFLKSGIYITTLKDENYQASTPTTFKFKGYQLEYGINYLYADVVINDTSGLNSVKLKGGILKVANEAEQEEYNLKPVVNIVDKEQEAIRGEVVQLVGNAYDKDGTIENILWELNDVSEEGININIQNNNSLNAQFTVPNVMPDKSFLLLFKLTATDDKGESDFSNKLIKVKGVGNSSPIAPTLLQATLIETNKVLLTWKDNSDDETGFTIFQDGQPLTIVGQDIKEYTVTLEGIEEGKQYRFGFQIVATNDAGDSGHVYAEIWVPDKEVIQDTGALKTGQVICYDWNTFEEEICTEEHKGQDGYYQKGLGRSYTQDGDIVIDNVTGLMWQDDEIIGINVWQGASEFCESIFAGGYQDWRLPTVQELQTLIDYSQQYPAIDRSVFQHIHSGPYWSATAYVSYTDNAWAVDFNDGDTFNSHKASYNYVRCVRNNQ